LTISATVVFVTKIRESGTGKGATIQVGSYPGVHYPSDPGLHRNAPNF
jgi:hypothetical protein